MKTTLQIASLLVFLALVGKASAQDSTAHVLPGEIRSAKGNTILVTFSGDDVPMPGQHAEMSKHIEKSSGTFSFTAWLTVADVVVHKVEGSKLTCKVLEEHSVVTVNGEKKNHFTSGSEVKLEWKSAP